MKLKKIKNPKQYKALHPETFGIPEGVELTFTQSPKGYVAALDENTWIGMPTVIIESNPTLFKYQRKHVKNGTKYEPVVRNRNPR